MAEYLLRDQTSISKQFPMMTDDVSASSSVGSISGETVSLYYNNGGSRTSDSGQAAGTAVQGRLANKNILDVAGSGLATYNDTSLSFTGNCLTTERKFPDKIAEQYKDASWTTKLSQITSGFSNGEYCIDYRSGSIWGLKATTTSSLTSVSYNINQAQTGSSDGLNTDIEGATARDAAASENPVLNGLEYEALGSLGTDANSAGDKSAWKGSDVGVGYVALTDAAGTKEAVQLEDSAHSSGDAGIMGLAVRNDTLTTLADTDGDYTPLQVNSSGALYVDIGGETIDLNVEGNVAHDAADSGNPIKMGGIARTSQASAVANDDRTNAVFNEYGELVLAGYDWSNNDNDVSETNPISDHHFEDVLANATAQGDGTTYYYFDMDGYRNFSIQLIDTAGAAGTNTYTVEATVQDDGTAQASCDYEDVTNDLFGSASYTTDDLLVSDLDIPLKYVRVKVVRTGDTGNTDGAWTIHFKQLY